MGHIDVSDQAAARFFGPDGPTGPVTMLNLLRFREVADYGDHPDLAPDGPISGREAYVRYSQHTLPLLEKAGGAVVMVGGSSHFLIGPQEERWDEMLLVRYPSREVFRGFATNPVYRSGYGHRVAALEDSRLLPIVETS